MSNSKVSLSFDEDTLRKIVSQIIVDHPNKDNLVKYFANLIISQYAAGEPFILTVLNALPEQVFYKGDKIEFDISSTYIQYNVKESEERGFCDDIWMKGTIISFNPVVSACYKVEFEMINSANEYQTRVYDLYPSQIRRDGVIPNKDRVNLSDLI